MTIQTIVDTGPLVAFFNKSEALHDWAFDQFTRLPPPLLTCEAVISETRFLLGSRGASLALEAIVRGGLRIEFSLGAEIDAVLRLMTRYKDMSASLADACLVRMSEIHVRSQILMLDRDFLVYRREGRRAIPLIAPFG